MAACLAVAEPVQHGSTELPRSEGVHLLPGTALVAVASCELAGATTWAAEATAEQRARKAIADFIGCIVEGRTEESMRMVARDTAAGHDEEAHQSFVQIARSSSKALLQGVRRVAAWRSEDGSNLYVAVRCAPHDATAYAPAAQLVHAAQVDPRASTSTIVVDGYAEYQSGTLDSVREAALRDGLRRAVAMVAGVLINADTATDERRQLRERIVSHTDGYVASYAIISEGRADDTRYYVRICARVATGAIRDNLQAMAVLRSKLNNPKVMCLFVETLDGTRMPNSRLINVLENMFRDQGIEVVDQTQVMASMADLDKDYYVQCVNDPARAAHFGRTHGAEVIIVGENKLQHLGRDPDGVFEQVAALTTIKAINASTAKILATATQAKDGIDTAVDGAAMMACKRVAQAVQQELFPRLVASWQQEANNGVRLVVIVQGVERYKMARDFRVALERVAGVLSVDQRAWRPRERHLELDVLFRGDINTFLDQAYDVVSALEEFEDIEPEQRGNAFVFRLETTK